MLVDAMCLEVPAGVRLGKASAILVRSVQAAPFEYAGEDDKRIQPLLVDMTKLDQSGS